MNADFEQIVSHYNVGALKTVSQVGTGLIHRTYRVETDQGVYVLQRLHDVISDAAIHDMYEVTRHVAACGILAPSLLRTKTGSFVANLDGARWRLYPWIEGHVVAVLTEVSQAHEAGRIVGDLHRALLTLPYIPQGSIPHFHETEFVIAELAKVLDDLPSEVRDVGKQVAELLPGAIVGEEAAPKQLIHGDLKISNLIFSPTGQAVGIIDFDTVLFHYRTIDMGDALRSWCNRTSEYDPRATFDTLFFEAAVRGYEGDSMSDEIRTRYLRATRHIALELAARSLTDVVKDTYFGWDPNLFPTRKAQNIARALGQFHFAQSVA